MKLEEEVVGKIVEAGLWSPDVNDSTPDPEELEKVLIDIIFTEDGDLFDQELNEKFFSDLINNENLLQLAFDGLLEKVMSEMEREIELYNANKTEADNEDEDFKKNKKKYLTMIKKTAKEKGESKSVAVQFEGVSHPIYMKAGDFCDLVEFTDKYDLEIKKLFANLPTSTEQTNTETKK